jgi:hypothetical protein
LKKQQRQRC